MFKSMARILILLVIAGYVALIGLALVSDRIIFQARPASYDDAQLVSPGRDAIKSDVRLVKVPVGNVALTAVYLPHPTATYTLLFSHGNAEDLGDDLPLLEFYRNAGFAVFAYDYRGYGTSPGSPSEKSAYEDVLAAYDYLVRELKVPPQHVIAFGRSLGAAMATEVASHRPVAGLIVEAPFVSAFRTLTRVPLLPWDKFRNGDKMRLVRCPVLVIHGRNDPVIPFRNGERIFALAKGPKRYLWVDGAGHNDVLFVAGPAYFTALKDFAALVETASRQ